MPRVKLCEPRKDYVKALILERASAYKLSENELACMIGVSRQTYSKLINHKHTDEWSLSDIKKLCRKLGITVEELRGAIRL